MKTLLFFTMLVPSLVFATTQIAETGGSADGAYSYIDPLNQAAYLNVNTTSTMNPPNFSADVHCTIDPKTNKPQLNYFVFKKADSNGIVRNYKTYRPGYTCQQIENDDAAQQPNHMTSVVGCKEFATPELVIDDPTPAQCGTTPCPSGAAHDVGVYIPLDSGKVAAARSACSGDGSNLMIIRDKVSQHAIFSDMHNKSSCNLDKRRVFLGNTPWDGCTGNGCTKVDETSSYVQVYTSKDPGFNIGAMVNPNNPSQPDSLMAYNYDFDKGTWCQTIFPDFGNSSPTCDPGYGKNMTFAMNFSTPGLNKTYHTGVVQLSMEGTTPVAYIGQLLTPNDPSPHPAMDPNKPLIKVTLERSDTNGAVTKFESRPSMTGAPTRTLIVTPNYTFGSLFNGTAQAGTCDGSTCLHAPYILAAMKTAGSLSCASNSTPLNLSNPAAPICYSCNGVTPGPCTSPHPSSGSDASGNPIYTYSADLHRQNILTNDNLQGKLNTLNQCRGDGQQAPAPDNNNTVTPTVE